MVNLPKRLGSKLSDDPAAWQSQPGHPVPNNCSASQPYRLSKDTTTRRDIAQNKEPGFWQKPGFCYQLSDAHLAILTAIHCESPLRLTSKVTTR
jgi:hypothetical protein